MELNLTGKKVILTGGSRGIGRASLEGFAAEGADVAFFSRDADQVAVAIESLARHGGRVFGEAFEVGDQDEYRQWLLGAADKLGGVDIFVHNVSSSGGDGTNWDQAFNLDLKCAVTGCQTLEPFLEKSSAAAVVLMSSTAAVETFIAPNAFNSLKGALLTYSGQLAQAWAAKNIRVNAVTPGPVVFVGGNWSKTKDAYPEVFEGVQSQIPMGRLGDPVDVANAILFLASSASSFTTGANLVIDGGFTKRVQF